MWLSSLIQAAANEDRIMFGYIRGDCFWHYRNEFENAFNALCALKGIEATLEYPIEYNYKADVLRKLKADNVPDCCWFTCEDTKHGEACGVCVNCEAIKEAKASWRYKSEHRQVKVVTKLK
jgi:hypothetical protein